MIKQVTAVIAILIAYAAKEMLRKHWMWHVVDPVPFQKAPNFREKEVPITYYESGKLGDVLKGWVDGFHVYRVKPGQNFHFDYKLIDSEILAQKLPPIEEFGPESVFCKRKFDVNRPEMVNLTRVFDEPGWYASFSRVNRETAAQLWNSLNLPFSVKESELEHGFFSNFAEPTVTSPIHGAPMVDSMSVTFIGSKSWFFFPPHVYLGEEGFRAVPAASVLVPQKVPTSDKPFDLYYLKTQPGDILFFPESWGHLVYTHEGPSFMVNYRNLIFNNFLRQPITYVNAFLNHLVFGKVVDSNAQTNTWPAKFTFSDQVVQKLGEAACPGGKLTPFDTGLLAYMKKRIAESST